MKFVDAHIHLSDEEYSGCENEVVEQAKNVGVVALVSNSMDLNSSRRSLELAKQYPGAVYAALGIHPWTVNNLADHELQQISDLISEETQKKLVVAVGEIGLDSNYVNIWNKQLRIFDSMLHLAERLNLPVIVHSRGTTAQTMDILPSYNIRKVLLHWFSDPMKALPKAIENGFYISEGAPTIYSKGIRDIVRKTPLSNLLTETDGPVRFHKPPFNGKRTTSAFIPTIVSAVAELKKTDAESVAEQVAKNFQSFFGIELGQAH